MRIQMIAIGSTGDVQPLVVLGKALIARGYEVTLTAFPALKVLTDGTGIAFRSIPGDAEFYIRSLIQPGANPMLYLSRFERALRGYGVSILDTLYETCRNADLVIATFLGEVIYTMAEHLGVPLIQTSYCLTDISSEYCIPVMPQLPLGKRFNRFTYRLAYLLIALLERRYLKPWCEAVGIRPRSSAKGLRHEVRGEAMPVLYAMSRHVFTRPQEWPANYHITGFWRERAHCENPNDALLSFLSGGAPPVFVGFGSMNSDDSSRALKAVLGAAEKNGQRILLSKGWGGLGASAAADENVYVLDEYVPHDWLFQRVGMIVHHGGAGTTAAALQSGRPELVVPFGSDQFFWGDRVHDLGCGPKPLPRTKLSEEKLSAKIRDLIENESYAANADSIRQLLDAENGAETAADIIERFWQDRLRRQSKGEQGSSRP